VFITCFQKLANGLLFKKASTTPCILPIASVAERLSKPKLGLNKMHYEFPMIRHISDVLPHIEGREEFIVAEREGL
jgi:hypothetical protein